MAVAIVGAITIASCATTVDLDVGAPTPDASAGESDVTVAPTEPAPDTAGPEPTPSPVPTPTPRPDLSDDPDLPYEEAIDRYVRDIERHWDQRLPELFGIAFEPVAQLIPYDAADDAALPPCDGDVGPRDLYVDNAFYCESDDYIAWDDVGLFPDLYRSFGDFTVGLVIAHEYGHAVQARVGLTGSPIYVELHADCLAGGWAADVATGEQQLFEPADLDLAIAGLLTFADPVGTSGSDQGAHGTAFDRVNAFAEGFENGTGACGRYIDDPPRTAGILIDPLDVSGGDLPLLDLLPLLISDLQGFFSTLGTDQLAAPFEMPGAPSEIGADRGDPPPCGGLAPRAADIAGSVYYCESDGIVYLDRAELEELWSEAGDFAPAYAVAHGYAMALVVQVGGQMEATVAVLAADCMVGVWARDVFDEADAAPAEPTHEIVLSAGDLDEGIAGLLLVPPLGPSLTAPADLLTFDRVAAFAAGFFRGVSECRTA